MNLPDPFPWGKGSGGLRKLRASELSVLCIALDVTVTTYVLHSFDPGSRTQLIQRPAWSPAVSVAKFSKGEYTMEDEFVILVADRNRHVREFLERELVMEGWRVLSARDGRELLHIIESESPPDLVILDLDIPYLNDLSILRRIQERKPVLPLVIHGFVSDVSGQWTEKVGTRFVEKCENVYDLKAVVSEMLRKFYPERVGASRR